MKIAILLACYCKYFDKSFIETFLELSSTIHMSFVQVTDFDWLPWQRSNEPRHEKTGLRGFRPGATQTGLCSLGRWLEL